MEQVLKEQALGSEGNLKLELSGGKLVLQVSYDGKGVDGSVSVILEPDYFIDLLADKIPGQIDDAIFAIMKAALKG